MSATPLRGKLLDEADNVRAMLLEARNLAEQIKRHARELQRARERMAQLAADVQRTGGPVGHVIDGKCAVVACENGRQVIVFRPVRIHA